MKKFTKIALIVASFVLVAALSVGGTIAWMTAQSQPVTNTFVKGEIRINLDEADVYENNMSTNDEQLGQPIPGAPRVQSNTYQAIPGNTYHKDPKVTVYGGSEKCWLFVEFIQEGNPSTYYTYTNKMETETGWTKGDGSNIPANVWYREVAESTEDQSWELLVGNSIAVKSDSVTQDNMNDAAAAMLKWNAYAVQYANLTAAEAWAEVAPTNP